MQWDYEVKFTDSAVQAVSDAMVSAPDAFVVVDGTVADLHASALDSILSQHRTLCVKADEESKSLSGVESLVDWLIDNRAVKSSSIIAIGGGCIQDLVSFTSHLYYRGIDWRFVPTTVLSQADSCIGAKSGINVLPFKNQLGALHSPRSIHITPEFLTTLPDLEIGSGYGEIVKLSVTSSKHFFSELEAALTSGGLRNPYLGELTRASLAAKQEIIEQDEAENDLRRVLNYGHSFGHALEAAARHQIPHGLGVLWGIDLINWLGVRWGLTDPQIASRISSLTRDHFEYVLPIKPTPEELLEQLARDKKVANGLMHFAILEKEGALTIYPRAIDVGLRADVAEYLETEYVFRRA